MINAQDYFLTRLIDLGGLRTGSAEVVKTMYCRDVYLSFGKAAGGNDVLVIEGSLDNTEDSYDNLDANDENVTPTTGKTTLYLLEGFLPPYVRIRKVSGENQIAIKLYIGGVS